MDAMWVSLPNDDVRKRRRSSVADERPHETRGDRQLAVRRSCLRIMAGPPQRELPLANPKGKFDTSQCDGCTPKGLEASHRGASAFDRSMILLNEIVEVLATPHLNVLPLRILPSQITKSQVALSQAIERDLARPPRQTRR